MLNNISIVTVLLVFNISLSYSLISQVDDTKVNVHCNLSDPINFHADIDRFLKQLSPNATELTINCRHQNISLNLESFPQNLSLEYLHFNGLSVDMLPNSFTNLKRLKYLGFANCDFSKLQDNPFGQLHNLVYLNLSSNAINLFSDLLIPFSSKFSQINLSNNRIAFLNKNVYDYLLKFVSVFDIRNNTLSCNCANKWIYSHNFDSRRLKIDGNSFATCNISHWNMCKETPLSITKYAYSFENIVLDCPNPKNSSSSSWLVYWISPHDERFGVDKLNHVKFFIQPLFIETTIWVNETSYSLYINNFRGYFRGNWTCIVDGTVVTAVTVVIKVHTKAMFDWSITIGFSFAGAWLFVAICVGLVQYCKETSCCRHKIDYNKSNLFEKRYVQTVIPVPFVDSISDSSSSNDSDLNCSKPLNRTRYDSHNNDVQLIFKDQELADEYAQMLSQLKEASETGDEHFKDRLTTLRTRFSIDFNKMRFELKRGMESLRSNSSAAAHKLRKSVGHMKDHMKSFTEFCGTSSMAQSISIVVISADGSHPNSNDPNRSSSTSYTRHEKKVFHFFEPL